MSRPVLGERVAFCAVLRRDKTWNGPVRWREEPATGEGIYIGLRVVFEGQHCGGYSGGLEGDPDPAYLGVERGISHALIVTHERKAPLRVPFAALGPLAQAPKDAAGPTAVEPAQANDDGPGPEGGGR